jgi:hypothetical protein
VLELPEKPGKKINEHPKDYTAKKREITQPAVEPEEKSDIKNAGSGKKEIVKVIILYSDQSFEAFTEV